MINQVTCTSNTVIELSRSELLAWVNNALKLNYNKIEQLGTGSAYCQLLDIIHPNKVPLNKVNFKAKTEYQYINNFKILQQSFTKLGIHKNIQIQKFVKCKYQDNLEFLQWFKKMFDANYSGKDFEPTSRRVPEMQTSGIPMSSRKQPLKSLSTNINNISVIPKGSQSQNSKIIEKKTGENVSFQQVLVELNKCSNLNAKQSSFKQQRQFYLSKLRQIELVMEKWDRTLPSKLLVQKLSEILLQPPPLISVPINMNQSSQKKKFKEEIEQEELML